MNATILPQQEATISSPEVRSLLYRYQLMPQVWQGMVIDRAISAFDCTEIERENAIAQFLAQHHLTSETERNTWLQSHQLTVVEMEELAIRPILFAIVRLEKLLPAKLDATMRQYLLNELFENWLQEQICLHFQPSGCLG